MRRPAGSSGLCAMAVRPSAVSEEDMSTFTLAKVPSRTSLVGGAVTALASLILSALRRRMRLGRDRRLLQRLPDYVLADMGLERIEFRAANGSRDVWFIPHRYY